MAAMVIAAGRQRSLHRADRMTARKGVKVDLTETMPPLQHFLKTGTLDSRSATSGDASLKRERFCGFTKDKFYLAILSDREGEDHYRIVDSIPLHEIENVEPNAPLQGSASRVQAESSARGPMPHMAKPRMCSAQAWDMLEPDEATGEKRAPRRGSALGSDRSLLAGLTKWSNYDGEFVISTTPEGYNLGRKYQFRALSGEDMQGWIDGVRAVVEEAKMIHKLEDKTSAWQKIKQATRRMVTSPMFENVSVAMILLSTTCSIMSLEAHFPRDTPAGQAFMVIEDVFTIIFTIEICMELIAFWFVPFFKTFWHIFDLLVVTVSLVAMVEENVPVFNPLRLIRVFRALRLIRKLKKLESIVLAISASVVPVCHSFVLLGMVTTIYACIAVELFKGVSEEQDILFGHFSSALFTMFQVCTGDSWATAVVRPMWEDPARKEATGRPEFFSAVFFVSYMVIAGMILVNIVIAVLLDEFLTTMSEERQLSATQQLNQASSFEDHVLDPVLEMLAQYHTPSNLKVSIKALFNRFDVDQSEAISYLEMSEGLRKMYLGRQVHFSTADWYDLMFDIGKPVLETLSLQQFDEIMIEQLRRYIWRLVNRNLVHEHKSEIGGEQWWIRREGTRPGLATWTRPGLATWKRGSTTASTRQKQSWRQSSTAFSSRCRLQAIKGMRHTDNPTKSKALTSNSRAPTSNSRP